MSFMDIIVQLKKPGTMASTNGLCTIKILKATLEVERRGFLSDII